MSLSKFFTTNLRKARSRYLLCFIATAILALSAFILRMHTAWGAPRRGIRLAPLKTYDDPTIAPGSYYDLLERAQSAMPSMNHVWRDNHQAGRDELRCIPKGSPWSSAEFPLASDFITAAEPAFELLKQAADIPLEEIQRPSGQRFSEPGGHLSTRALRDLSLANCSQAISTVKTLLRLAERSSIGSSLWDANGTGCMVQALRLAKTVALLSDDAEQLASLEKILLTEGRHLQPLAESCRYEFIKIRDYLAHPEKGDPMCFFDSDRLPWRISPFSVLVGSKFKNREQNLRCFYSELLEHWEKFGEQADPTPCWKNYTNFSEPWHMCFHSDPMTRIYLTKIGHSISSDHSEMQALQTLRRAILTIIRLQRYKRSHGTWPNSLAELNTPQSETAMVPPLDYCLRNGEWQLLASGAPIAASDDAKRSQETLETKRKALDQWNRKRIKAPRNN